MCVYACVCVFVADTTQRQCVGLGLAPGPLWLRNSSTVWTLLMVLKWIFGHLGSHCGISLRAAIRFRLSMDRSLNCMHASAKANTSFLVRCGFAMWWRTFLKVHLAQWEALDLSAPWAKCVTRVLYCCVCDGLVSLSAFVVLNFLLSESFMVEIDEADLTSVTHTTRVVVFDACPVFCGPSGVLWSQCVPRSYLSGVLWSRCVPQDYLARARLLRSQIRRTRATPYRGLASG